jgi:molybdopterin synthase catalytic subunit
MDWDEIKQAYPDQWIVIEAMEAHSEGGLRVLDRVAVIATCPDGESAVDAYRKLHDEFPEREFYFIHTSRATLQIEERLWVGIRSIHAD